MLPIKNVSIVNVYFLIFIRNLFSSTHVTRCVGQWQCRRDFCNVEIDVGHKK